MIDTPNHSPCPNMNPSHARKKGHVCDVTMPYFHPLWLGHDACSQSHMGIGHGKMEHSSHRYITHRSHLDPEAVGARPTSGRTSGGPQPKAAPLAHPVWGSSGVTGPEAARLLLFLCRREADRLQVWWPGVYCYMCCFCTLFVDHMMQLLIEARIAGKQAAVVRGW